MAKAFGGINGNWSGKVGNSYGRYSDGTQFIAAMPVTNPDRVFTAEQVEAQKKLSLLSQYLGPLSKFFRQSFTNSGPNLSNYALALKKNYPLVSYSRSTQTATFDFAEAVLGNGNDYFSATISESSPASGVTATATISDLDYPLVHATMFIYIPKTNFVGVKTFANIEGQGEIQLVIPKPSGLSGLSHVGVVFWGKNPENRNFLSSVIRSTGPV